MVFGVTTTAAGAAGSDHIVSVVAGAPPAAARAARDHRVGRDARRPPGAIVNARVSAHDAICFS